MRKRIVEAGSIATLIAMLAAALLLGIAPLDPPEPLPAGAIGTEFSAQRAIEHVRVVAAAPHPVGSQRQSEVRDYIVNALDTIGLEGVVQETQAQVRRNQVAESAVVRNIVATIPGARSSKALLLAAHYDSTSRSPGASDNAAAVATLLETARALLAGPRLANDVTFLFTDGEEAGLLGARSFMDKHPAAANVGLVLNFDARGRTGPVVMFETAGPALALVQVVAGSVAHPVAMSFSEDVYKRMPNRTDFTVFKRGGMEGLNFAFFAEPKYYHSTTDTLANLDPGTLQHQGSYAVSLARALGDRELPLSGDRRRAIYFNAGRSLLFYPESWAMPLAVLTLFLSLAVVVIGLTKKLLTFRGLAIGSVLVLALVIASVLIGFGAGQSIAAPLGARDGALGSGARYLAIVCAGVFVLVAIVSRLTRRFAGAVPLLVALHACWTLCAAVLAFAAPSASYLFLWPAAAGVVVQMLLFARLRRQEPVGTIVAAALALPAIPALILVTPAIAMTYAAVGAAITPVAALFAALTMAFLVPTWQLAWEKRHGAAERVPAVAVSSAFGR